MIDRLIMNGAKVVAEKYADRFAKGIADERKDMLRDAVEA